MARKPKGQSTPQEEFAGFPEHGDPAPDDNPDLEAQGEDENDEDDEPNTPEPKQTPDEVAALKADLEDLRRRIPPASPAPAPAPKTEDDEPDWDKLLYDDPKAAMRLHGERVAAKVKQELTATYQREKGQETFWKNFYDKNKDLKNDHDLVEVTLKGNLNDLANIPVEKAMEKLADLTRDRILRYAGGKPKGGSKKAVAEGAAAPSAPKATPEPNAPSSLSDIIKARARKRRGQVAA
jgi:hypothetical protein